MAKLLVFILIIWIIIKFIGILLRIRYRREKSNIKKHGNHKTGMEIIDADYEEVE